jgi:glycosyltransferase involved in cell wall biosynthesis
METVSKPLVSVITLAYNSQFLKEAIDSVLSQDYPNIQYIISDDCSDSFDCDYWKSYIHDKKKENIFDLIVTSFDKHLGTVRNYNNALKLAVGKYIFPLSGDDTFCSETSLSQWTKAFIHNNTDILGAKCCLYDITMTECLGTWPSFYDSLLLKYGSIQQIYRRLEYKKIIPGCSLARTKESVDRIGFFDEDYYLLEDYPFIMKSLRDKNKIGFYDRVVVRHRRGGVSDPTRFNTLLAKDMELFYSKDVYPFSNDPFSLKKRLNLIHESELTRNHLCNSWSNLSFSAKFNSFFKHPVWVIKMFYKRLTK